MDRSKWNNKGDMREKSKPHRRHKAKYFVLIGMLRGKKKFRYIDGHRFYSCMLGKMQNMAMSKDCDYYRMEVHPCPNGQGALFELLAEVNRGRGDETNPDNN